MRSIGFAVLTCAAGVLLPPACLPSSFSGANVGMLPGASPTQAYVSEISDLNDFWWNPAGLGYLERAQAVGGYMDYLTSLKGGFAGFGAPGGRGLAYCLYMSYLSSGQVGRTDYDDPAGDGGETFTFGELVGGLSVGMSIHKTISAGASFKFAREQVDADFKTGMLADLGAAFRLYAGRGWPREDVAAYVTAVARNVLIVHDGEGAESPMGVEAGVSLAGALNTPFSGGISFYAGRRGLREVRGGVIGMLSDEFRARLGYRRRVGDNSDSSAGFSYLRGLTAGFGVRFGKVWIDYTYEDGSPLDAIHRFGLTYAAAAPN